MYKFEPTMWPEKNARSHEGGYQPLPRTQTRPVTED